MVKKIWKIRFWTKISMMKKTVEYLISYLISEGSYQFGEEKPDKQEIGRNSHYTQDRFPFRKEGHQKPIKLQIFVDLFRVVRDG